MILSETINGMVSEDYKKRFIAEYQQLVIRYKGLKKMLDNWDKNELAFTPTCPRSTYNMQIKAMSDYIAVLEARAVMEGIDLEKSFTGKNIITDNQIDKINEMLKLEALKLQNEQNEKKILLKEINRIKEQRDYFKKKNLTRLFELQEKELIIAKEKISEFEKSANSKISLADKNKELLDTIKTIESTKSEIQKQVNYNNSTIRHYAEYVIDSIKNLVSHFKNEDYSKEDTKEKLYDIFTDKEDITIDREVDNAFLSNNKTNSL